MTQIDILSYRKLSFAKRFGFTVRDLMILKSIETSNEVSKIHWYERPDTIVDFVKSKFTHFNNESNIFAPKAIDWNVFGALRYGRAWAAESFKLYPQLNETANPKIILDFNPFFIPSLSYLKDNVYWYDVIDNFLLHNRYTEQQLQAVAAKYEFVKKNANFITGVTEKSLSPFGRGQVLPNRLIRSDWTSPIREQNKRFDFGFIGFITDKFDLGLVEALAKSGRSILISGQSYDGNVIRTLKDIPGVEYTGPFNSAKVQEILAKFKIGLIPYRREKLHDESPIKFFQYVCAGLPVITSTKFNVIEDLFAKYIHYYSLDDLDAINSFFDDMNFNYDTVSVDIKNKAMSSHDIFWDDTINKLVNRAKESRG